MHALIACGRLDTLFTHQATHCVFLPRAGLRGMFMEEIPPMSQLLTVEFNAELQMHHRSFLLGFNHVLVSELVVDSLPRGERRAHGGSYQE